MSIWASVMGTAAGLMLGGPLGALASAAGIGTGPTRPLRNQVAFTVAAIALAAKMAVADGVASEREFAEFERLFRVDDSERANAARFYRLAQGSTLGFEAYAEQAAKLLGPGSPILEDLLEALLLIARVDGFEVAELDYLDAVATRMGFSAADYARIRARHGAPVGTADNSAWTVLGVAPGADAATLRAAYRGLVKTYHPDRQLANGTPPEFIRVAEDRMAAINAAYDAVSGRR